MEKVNSLVSEIDAIDALSDEIENPQPVSVKPAVPVVRSEPPPAPANVEAKVQDVKTEAVPATDPAPQAEKVVGAEKIPIMPVTGKILEDVSSALDLIAVGMQAKIVRSNLQEQADQLGPLSMLLSMVKKAKDQADQLLGRAQS